MGVVCRGGCWSDEEWCVEAGSLQWRPVSEIRCGIVLATVVRGGYDGGSSLQRGSRTGDGMDTQQVDNQQSTPSN